MIKISEKTLDNGKKQVVYKMTEEEIAKSREYRAKIEAKRAEIKAKKNG